MTRAVLIVLDSVGVGGAEDAAAFGDAGADTLGHIAAECRAGRADCPGLRHGPLRLPNLGRLGLGAAAEASTGIPLPDIGHKGPPQGRFGYGVEISRGKDTQSGHWEIAGQPVMLDWGYFPETVPCFPQALTETLVAAAELPGILGGKHASGTAIIAELGMEHVRSGKPICYASADSVFQIAAHEIHFGLDRLYRVCEIARGLVDRYNIGRVIARPFVGESPDDFVRTPNRHDFAVTPPEPTLLDRLTARSRRVVGVGKVGDIFAHRGIAEEIDVASDAEAVEAIISRLPDLGDGDLLFANLVDFDGLYGHRRDVTGYAAALEAFDRRLPDLERLLGDGDLAVVTADHGNDPTFRGNDHTREHVPILAFGPGIGAGPIGRRETLADIGESIAAHLGREPGAHGRSLRPG